MENKSILKILKAHSIEAREENKQVIATTVFYNIYTKETGMEEINLTGYTKKQLFEYLGY